MGKIPASKSVCTLNISVIWIEHLVEIRQNTVKWYNDRYISIKLYQKKVLTDILLHTKFHSNNTVQKTSLKNIIFKKT